MKMILRFQVQIVLECRFFLECNGVCEDAGFFLWALSFLGDCDWFALKVV